MFEKFTQRARLVVVLAQEEARAHKNNYIGTEHFLLGLLREEEGLGARVLQSLDITVERVRDQVVKIVGRGEEATFGQIPFTPRAKRVLELALLEALKLGHNTIGTEHILLGLARQNQEDPGVAAHILRDLGVNPEKIRNEVIGMLDPRARQRAQTPAGQLNPDRLVLQIEVAMTPPPAGLEQLNRDAIEAVQRVYENGGAQLHHAGVRRVDPSSAPPDA